jgi:leucyl/phenylalanyl-tRNA--protein transferase
MMDLFDLPLLSAQPQAPFPPTSQALEVPNGLLAWGGDLAPERVLRAYRQGIFPWYSGNQPILWWSPAPRCVIFPAEIHVSRRTRRRYNSGQFHLTADSAFDSVVEACSKPRDDDGATWITDEIKQCFHTLHRLGHAHSVEVWRGQELAGGLYGLAIGRMFFGESMFSRETDASKIGLAALCRHLAHNGFGMLDCQVSNPHLLSLAAVELGRDEFEARLGQLTAVDGLAGAWSACFHLVERW